MGERGLREFAALRLAVVDSMKKGVVLEELLLYHAVLSPSSLSLRHPAKRVIPAPSTRCYIFSQPPSIRPTKSRLPSLISLSASLVLV
jgi:hypothetical protein